MNYHPESMTEVDSPQAHIKCQKLEAAIRLSADAALPAQKVQRQLKQREVIAQRSREELQVRTLSRWQGIYQVYRVGYAKNSRKVPCELEELSSTQQQAQQLKQMKLRTLSTDSETPETIKSGQTRKNRLDLEDRDNTRQVKSTQLQSQKRCSECEAAHSYTGNHIIRANKGQRNMWLTIRRELYAYLE